jgi:ATP sulfurylase
MEHPGHHRTPQGETYLVGGAITILKNINISQWEGLYIPYNYYGK